LDKPERNHGRRAELAHLLTWKFIYTAVSLALLLGLWWFFVRHSQRRAET
jgi:hypothetical protein